MQIDSLKDSTKVLELGLKDTGKEIKEPESANEKISLGEAFNKNIRTKVMTYGDTVNKLREEDRAVSKFKEQAEKATKTLEYNAKMLSPEIMKGLEENGVSATDSDADLVMEILRTAGLQSRLKNPVWLLPKKILRNFQLLWTLRKM